MNGPVFIGGCPRSGTTALWNALMQHPHFTWAEGRSREKELWFLQEFFEGRKATDMPRRSHALDQEFERAALLFFDGFLRQHCASEQGRYVNAHVENIFHANKITAAIPGARVLLMIRHPQENVWSLLNSFFSEYIRRSRSAELITEDEILRATQIWKVRAQIVLRALAGEFGAAVKVVRQERMVTEPQALAREVLEFIGAPYDECVGLALASGIINTSFLPDREPGMGSFLDVVPVANAAQRLAFFERTRRRLVAAPNLCATVRMSAAEEMRLLGYQDLADSTSPSPDEKPVAVRRLAELKEVVLSGRDGHPRSAFIAAETAILRIAIVASASVENLSASYLVRDADLNALFGTTTFDERVELGSLTPGKRLVARFSFPMALKPGKYTVTVACNSVSHPGYADNVLHHEIEDIISFDVTASPERPIHYKFMVPTKAKRELPWHRYWMWRLSRTWHRGWRFLIRRAAELLRRRNSANGADEPRRENAVAQISGSGTFEEPR